MLRSGPSAFRGDVETRAMVESECKAYFHSELGSVNVGENEGCRNTRGEK